MLPASSSRSDKEYPSPGSVVVLDTDNRYDIERFKQVLSDHYERRYSPAGVRPEIGGNSTSTTDTALRHVHLFRPQSLESLVTTISGLRTYLFDFQQHQSSARPLSLIVIDSVTAFFWPHRWDQETVGLQSNNGVEKPVLSQSHQTEYTAMYTNLVAAIREVQATFACPVVGTSNSLVNSKPLLPFAWRNNVAIRLVVRRGYVKQFPSEMKLVQATQDRTQRQEVVDRGRFAAVVDNSCSEAWSQTLRDALRKDSRLTGFEFRISSTGVTMEL